MKETLLQFRHFQEKAESADARANQFVVISPMAHGTAENLTENTVTGERWVGDARMDLWGLYLRWFDYRLRDAPNAFAKTPRIQYYTCGLNIWKSSHTWPPPGVRDVSLYLSSCGKANSRLGGGKLDLDPPEKPGTNMYRYDPDHPIFNMTKAVQLGSFDCAELELRDDILVYSTPPLAEGVEITGFMKAILFLSCDTPDTDVAVKILDVHPDGRAFGLQEGYLRLRYREGFDREVMMTPGEVYEIDVDLQAYSNYFGTGHQIRIEITGSNMPIYARNLNTGGDNARDTERRVATVTVHHGEKEPSRIVLPVVETTPHFEK